MIDKYRRSNTCISMINYHIIFCPRYRRKIFDIPGVESRLKEIIVEVCNNNDIKIIAMECDKYHIHLFVNASSTVGISELVKTIKGCTSIKLRKEFKQLRKMPSLWTRSYFVSTAGDVYSSTIKWYIENQKNK